MYTHPWLVFCDESAQLQQAVLLGRLTAVQQLDQRADVLLNRLLVLAVDLRQHSSQRVVTCVRQDHKGVIIH